MGEELKTKADMDSDEEETESVRLECVEGTASALQCLFQALESAGPQPHLTYAPARLCTRRHCATCLALQLQRNVAPESAYKAPGETEALLLHSALRLAPHPDWKSRLERRANLHPAYKTAIHTAVEELGRFYAEHFNVIGEQSLCLAPAVHWSFPAPNSPRIHYARTARLFLTTPALSYDIRFCLAQVYGAAEEEREPLRPHLSQSLKDWLQGHAQIIHATTQRLGRLAASNHLQTGSQSQSQSQPSQSSPQTEPPPQAEAIFTLNLQQQDSFVPTTAQSD